MLRTLERLRRNAVNVMREAVESLDAPTEIELRDEIHARLSLDGDLTEDGWYTPPPHGIIVAIANPPDYQRLRQVSYRPEAAWPSREIRLTHESVVYLYQSRVHRPTGLISDVAFTFYRGSNPRIAEHIANVFDVTMQIVNSVSVGMTFADVYRNASTLIGVAELANTIVSVTDPAGVNIGHTIPWTDESITVNEKVIIDSGSPVQVAELINSKRVFVNALENYVIGENVVFSIEPRLQREDLPVVSFHVLVGFENGVKRVFADFD